MLSRHVICVLREKFSGVMPVRKKLSSVIDLHNANKWLIIQRMNRILKTRKTASAYYDYTLEKGEPDEKPPINYSFMGESPMAPHKRMFGKTSFKEFVRVSRLCDDREQQSFSSELFKSFGCELSAAYMMVCLGGKVQKEGSSNWIYYDENNKSSLPDYFDPNFVVSAIDASGIPLYYEGLDHLCGLQGLKWLSLQGCGAIDDWCIDRISGEFPTLEYLDISNCPNVTERGLEALYRATNLQRLIITKCDTIPFELSCLMLEDCNRQLTCEILQPTPVPLLESSNKQK